MVSAIVLPTRQSYRQAQLWADAFPTAAIYTSSPVPMVQASPNDMAITSLQVHTKHENINSKDLQFQDVEKAECITANVTC